MELKVALCQTDIEWGQKELNLAAAKKAVGAADADIVVFPEMFTTGFDMCPETVAEPINGPTVAWLQKTALFTGKALVCTIPVMEKGPGGREYFYNRLFFAEPGGRLHQYDKRHLFSYSGEDKLYSPGYRRIIIEYKGFRILPLICYDLRFPVWSRGSDEFDLMLYVASWPQTRIGVWDTLLKARAIENQCYVAGANRVGSDPTAQYNGHSAAYGFYGEKIVVAPEGEVAVVTATFDLEALQHYREKFPAWRDADKFGITL